MDYRCSRSIAGLVLLIGGFCAFLAPAARAGDRIEFSAPIIPLAVPKPAVEIKELQKPISASNPADDSIYDADFLPQPQVSMSKPRSKDKDRWGADPRRDDSDPRAADDLFNARLEPNRFTNGSIFNTKRGWNGEDSEKMLLRNGDSKDSKLSRFGIDADGSKLNARNGWEKANGRTEDLYGRDFSNKRTESSLFKVFSLDPAASDRFDAWNPKSFTGQLGSLTGAGAAATKFKLGSPTDFAHTAEMPPGYGSYDPTDNRQTGQQTASAAGYGRSWEPADARPAPARRSSGRDQISPSRTVAPVRPATLAIPKKPSDPNPY